jgi:hypothetical protein
MAIPLQRRWVVFGGGNGFGFLRFEALNQDAIQNASQFPNRLLALCLGRFSVW